jgi:hypothetical protein
MWNAWDTDTKLLAILVVAAIISLAVTHETVLAHTVDGVIQTVEGTVKRFADQAPSDGKEPTRASDPARSFHSEHTPCRMTDDRGMDTSTRFVVVDRHPCCGVLYPCRTIRRCRP